MFKKLGISAAVLAGLSLLTPAAAPAEPRHGYGGHWNGGPYYHGGIYFGPYVGPYYGPTAEGYYDQWGVWHPYFGVGFGW